MCLVSRRASPLAALTPARRRLVSCSTTECQRTGQWCPQAAWRCRRLRARRRCSSVADQGGCRCGTRSRVSHPHRLGNELPSGTSERRERRLALASSKAVSASNAGASPSQRTKGTQRIAGRCGADGNNLVSLYLKVPGLARRPGVAATRAPRNWEPDRSSTPLQKFEPTIREPYRPPAGIINLRSMSHNRQISDGTISLGECNYS